MKVPRPTHEQQKPGVIEAFKNYFPERIKGLTHEIREQWGDRANISYWFQDETRLGYRTESGRQITRAGVQPKQIWQWDYSYYYIYGLVDPLKGRSFFSEFSHFNSDCLGLFLEQFTQEYSAQIHIIQIDLPLTNCSWDYKAANLIYQSDTSPILVDPDHGGRIPRMYDLATALLLFHCDLPSAPNRMFTPQEWVNFLEGYKQSIQPTIEEQKTWSDLLLCTWMDQALWLLSHFPEGWANANADESVYLLGLLTINLDDFSLSF